jgi:hypothetical protein
MVLALDSTREDLMQRSLLLSILLPVVLAGSASAVSLSAAPDVAVTVPAGTVLHLRLDDSVGSDISRVEEPVCAEVIRPVIVRGRTIVPTRSLAGGRVIAVRHAGHLRQRSLVTVRFTRLTPGAEEPSYRIRTRAWSAVGPSLTGRDLKGIGLPAAGGAIIGAIIGGGKSAGIGAAAGGGAGAARLEVTRGRDVRVPRAAVVLVRLTQPLRVEVPAR